MTEYFFNGVCGDCFCKVQKEKNSCVCPFKKIEEKDEFYYCSFCEEFHSPLHGTMCKECAEKQDSGIQTKKVFFSIGLPSIFFGVVIGLFLGGLLFIVLRRKSKKQKTK